MNLKTDEMQFKWSDICYNSIKADWTSTMPRFVDATMPSAPANPSSLFQLKEAGYSDAAASTATQTIILCHMPVVRPAALVTCFRVHGFAIVAMHGVSTSR